MATADRVGDAHDMRELGSHGMGTLEHEVTSSKVSADSLVTRGDAATAIPGDMTGAPAAAVRIVSALLLGGSPVAGRRTPALARRVTDTGVSARIPGARTRRASSPHADDHAMLAKLLLLLPVGGFTGESAPPNPGSCTTTRSPAASIPLSWNSTVMLVASPGTGDGPYRRRVWLNAPTAGVDSMVSPACTGPAAASVLSVSEGSFRLRPAEGSRIPALDGTSTVVVLPPAHASACPALTVSTSDFVDWE